MYAPDKSQNMLLFSVSPGSGPGYRVNVAPKAEGMWGMPGSGKGLSIGLREETKTARGDF